MPADLTIPETPSRSLPPEEVPSGYYRVREDYKGKSYGSPGTLFNIYVEKETIHAFHLDSHWTFDRPKEEEDFRETFEYYPEGEDERDALLRQTQTELRELDFQTQKTGRDMKALNVYAGVIPEAPVEASGTPGLIPTNNSLVSTKLVLAKTRDHVLRLEKGFREKTALIEALIQEKVAALELRSKELQGLLAKAQSAMWTVNLYLGKDEQITVLQKGNPAPPGEKITLRQRVLHMDEECAIDAKSGGIDVDSLHKFDEWLLKKPKNLQQILPEPKGVVALHVRRGEKAYKGANPLWAAETNQANKTWTYFLIRNGERLYRVYVDLPVPRQLFPTADDMPTPPEAEIGTPEYYEELDKADKDRDADRTYLMRIALVMQGLIDRTGVFRPLPTEQFNLFNPAVTAEWVRYIYDDEKLLTDGRPTFREWQKEVNAHIDVGHRVVGHWGYWLEPHERDYEYGRMIPKRSSRPDSKELHTIVRVEDGGRFVFLFKRKHNWRDYDLKTRASCYVRKDDKQILDFDAVNLKDLRYYLKHRESKKNYSDMMPVLEAAIKAKVSEIEEEKPFRQLLVGQIMKDHGADQEEAEQAVKELVPWWKLKNREHRALTSADALALRTIVKEYRLRKTQSAIRAAQKTRHEVVVAAALKLCPAAVAVWHVRDNEYVSFEPSNRRNVFVDVRKIQATPAGLVDEVRHWKTVDKRYLRWELLYQSDRWGRWRINPVRTTVLNDPQIQDLLTKALEMLERRGKFGNAKSGYDSYGRKWHFRPISAEVNNKFQIRIWSASYDLVGKKTRPYSEGSEGPAVTCETVEWVLKFREETPTIQDITSQTYHQSAEDFPREDVEDDDCVEAKADTYRTLRTWPENLAFWKKSWDDLEEIKTRREEINNRYSYAEDAARVAMSGARVLAERQKYDDEFGAADLWPDYLKGLKLSDHLYARKLDHLLTLLAERDIDPVGQTVAWVHKTAGPFLKEFTKGTGHGPHRNHDEDWAQPDEWLSPLWVIPPKPPNEGEDEEDKD